MKKRSSYVLCSALTALSMISGVSVQAEETPGNVIQAWENPEVTAKPAARNWYPDAGAGADYNLDGGADYLDQVYAYIEQMYEGGFGSVELTWLNTNSFFDEEYAAEIGWGTDAYCEIICAALDAANHCEDGFQIDVTITAHWPITINSVTPNDPASAQSIVLADMQPLSAEDLEQEILPLQMAETWLCDNANSTAGSGSSDATYIFKDTLVSAVLAKLNEDGTVSMDSLVTLGTGEELDAEGSAIVTADSWAVGIPGEETAYIEFQEDENGHHFWNLSEEAPEGAELNVSGSSTLVVNDDYYDDRELMADEQTEYGVLTDVIQAVIGEEDPSSFVLLNSYYRGSGETCSGGAAQMMEGKAYVTDYFSAEGADAVLDYWTEKMLPYTFTTMDQEETTMAELMKENVEKCGASSIFEDSIELNPRYTGGVTFWTANALKDFEEEYGYDVSSYVYVMMDTDIADDSEEADLIYNDFAMMMGNLYVKYHSSYINSFFNEAVGYQYRAQAYELDGMLDVGLAAMTCGFGESDNSTSNDADRLLAGANILSGSLYTTNEALTFGYDEYQVWRTELKAMNNLFSEGVSHIILHGSAFNRASALNEAASAWPGWNFRMVFDGGKVYTGGFMSWGPRQPHWEDESALSDYVTRVQTLLQMGQQKTNIAYLSDRTEDTGFNGGTSFQTLLDCGLTYTPLTHGEFESDYVTLNEDGTVSNLGFQAIILNNVETTTVQNMEKLAEFAENGILIINTNAGTKAAGFGMMPPGTKMPEEETENEDEEKPILYPNRVIGTDSDGSSAAAIQECMDRIMAYGSVIRLAEGTNYTINEDGSAAVTGIELQAGSIIAYAAS